MATVIQPGFFDLTSGDFVLEAKRRFPFSAKHNLIFGSGAFPLSQRCRTPWIIKLYNTAADRREAANNSCGGSRCMLNHRIEENLDQ